METSKGDAFSIRHALREAAEVEQRLQEQRAERQRASELFHGWSSAPDLDDGVED